MFDRTFIAPTDVNVHVQQQPNGAAAAARLYKECLEKAESEVASATIVKFGVRNELTGVKIDSCRSFHDEKLHVRLLFSINDEKFDIQVEDTYKAMTQLAYREIALRLMNLVLCKMLPPRTDAPR